MNITIQKINDECLSKPKYQILLNNKLYVGNLTKKGLKFWKELVLKKYFSINTARKLVI